MNLSGPRRPWQIGLKFPCFRWEWAESRSKAAYTNWSNGEPNNSHNNDVEEEVGENCVHLSGPHDKNGKWNDFPCHCSTECRLGPTVEPIFALCESGPHSTNRIQLN